MWTYRIVDGWLLDPNDLRFNKGYSGAPGYKNDPGATNLHQLGPIPVGFYTMGEPVLESDHGPFAIPLIPDETNKMFGRSGFMLHGERLEPPPGCASEGCIIQSPESVRKAVWNSNDHCLQVVSGIVVEEEEV